MIARDQGKRDLVLFRTLERQLEGWFKLAHMRNVLLGLQSSRVFVVVLPFAQT